MNQNFFKKIPFIVYILIGAAVMRLINLSSMSLSNDELSALIRLRYSSVQEMIVKGVYIDFHPAGVQLFLYYWVKLFGDGVFMFRLPFVLFSLGTIYLIYKIGKQWYSEITALTAAAVFAFLPFTIQLSQFARMYSPGIFFSLLACYGWINYLFFSGEKKYGWMWFAGMFCCIHIHYFAFVYAGLLGITGLFFLKKEKVKFYLSAGTVAVLSFALEWKIFQEQMKTGDIGGWLPAPDKTFLLRYMHEMFNNSAFLLVLVSVLMLFGIIKVRDGKWKWRAMSIIWFGISFLIAYLYSVLGHPVIQYSTLYFTYPFLLLFIFSFLPQQLTTHKFRWVFVVLFSAHLISSTIASGYYTKPRFGVFKEIANDVSRARNKYDSGLKMVVNVINPEYYRYYDREKEVQGNLIFKVESGKDLAQLISIVDTSTSKYFGYCWTNSSHPDEIVEIIARRYPHLIERKSYFNASFYLFGKEGKRFFGSTTLFENNFDEPNQPIDLSHLTTLHEISLPNAYIFKDEYGPDFSSKISELPGTGYRILSCTVSYFDSLQNTDALLVMSIENKNGVQHYYSSSLDDFHTQAGFNTVYLSRPIPDKVAPDDVLKIYIWNKSKKLFYIDDMRISIRNEIDPYKSNY